MSKPWPCGWGFCFSAGSLYVLAPTAIPEHLHRYLAEFDFRHNARIALGVNDQTRADNALKGIVGKRLTYRTVNH